VGANISQTSAVFIFRAQVAVLPESALQCAGAKYQRNNIILTAVKTQILTSETTVLFTLKFDVQVVYVVPDIT
jgi:hypothetical protein